MPKGPILNREVFYDTLGDGTLRFLDWNLVSTELGAMIEPRSLSVLPANNKVVQVDVVDSSFTRFSPMNEDAFYRLTGFSGRQVPVNFQ